MEIYLDHASTTPIHPLVMNSINQSYKMYYANPSSVHEAGYQALNRIEEARKNLLKLLDGSGYDLIFTSGATEANNTIINGSYVQAARKHDSWLCSAIEHPSVLKPYELIKSKGAQVRFLSCDSSGLIRLDDLEGAITPETKLISLMHVNNETGVIQPIEHAVTMIRNLNPKTRIHVDGVQAFGKIDSSLKKMDPDYYSISAHKIGGPRGMGALIYRKSKKPMPLLWGGGQEKNLRSGTENTPGIVGFETAAILRHQSLQQNTSLLWAVRHQMIRQLHDQVGGIKLIEADTEAEQVPGILLISVDGTRSEVILRMLSDDHIYVSAGSACSSRKTAASHVLKAMSLDEQTIQGALRISFDETLTARQIDRFTQKLANHTHQMRKMIKR
ncbi:MAG: cysteine desulfurase family protein [Bacillota bacterium]|nr:cysteine desulfurase family protein [Bacillota bacterium]MDW7678421.1 cysteine desulfurase family protein [Bacillota bacterium]